MGGIVVPRCSRSPYDAMYLAVSLGAPTGPHWAGWVVACALALQRQTEVYRPTLHSDIDISLLGPGAVLSLDRVEAAVVSISIPNEEAAGSDVRGDLHVDHDSLVNLLAIFVPHHLGNGSAGDAAAEPDVVAGPQRQQLVWRPLNLRGNWGRRGDLTAPKADRAPTGDGRMLWTYCSHPWS